jgi:hypothetical protein
MEKNEIRERLIKQLKYLKTLSNREYLLLRKYNELENEYNKDNKYFNKVEKIINEYILLPEELNEIVNNILNKGEKYIDNNLDLDIKFVNNKEDNNIWTKLRQTISVLYWSQNPGRNIKFFVTLNNKIIGLLSLGSDVMSIGVRDKFIGWDKEQKLGKKRINNLMIVSSIIPIQPLGYNLVGGKLISLMLYHNKIRKIFREKYNQELVGLSTTSLFGIKKSQYNGFPKYWKPLGETVGTLKLSPLENVYSLMREWLKENYKNEYEFVQTKTGPKQNVIQLFYKKSEFNKYWKKETGFRIKDLNQEFKRGVYFARLYDNTLNFLRCEIEEKDLIPRSNLDFDINNTNNSIMKYWWKKWGNKRYNKLNNENKLLNNFWWIDLRDINGDIISLEEFMNKNKQWQGNKFEKK